MKLNGFIHSPRMLISITKGDVAILVECAHSHYDGVCQQVAKPGTKSFLYGWAALGEMFVKDPIEVEASSCDLNLTMKILEMGIHLYSSASPDKLEAWRKLDTSVREIWKSYKAEYNRLNPQE